MSFCIECLNFVRRKGNNNQRCMKNNPMKLCSLDAKVESLFRKCSDCMLDKERFFARDVTQECQFEVTYHGLLEKQIVATVDSEEKAQKMCLQHNTTVPDHYFDAGIGRMSYKDRVNLNETSN